MKFKIIVCIVCLASFVSCKSDDDYTEITELLEAEVTEEFAGGDTTVFDESGNAFEFAARNVENDQLTAFVVGNSLFEQNWVSGEASTTARDGLGPFFNARSCSGCHLRDGRGKAPEISGEINHGLLLRLSIDEIDEYGHQLGDPIYGGQLQDQSISSVDVEGNFEIQYTENKIEYPDGEVISLRMPTYVFTSLAYGSLGAATHISPRVGNQMIGLGLLDAISESDLLLNTDEFDSDNDGISGRVNRVWDFEKEEHTIGRFGWKANQPNLKQQIAGAFLGDLGITSSLFSNENCTEGVDCNSLPNGGDVEIEDNNLNNVTFYASTLAVPARRDYDTQETLEGKKLFNEAKCTSCHIPKFTTGNHEIEALTNQVIYPYTDLLLHNMGEGLADNASDYLATGKEWRTPPLWGIGLIPVVNKHTNLLHDGRARNVEEAILWHGGEAENSKQEFMSYSKEDRGKVIDFINTL